jgi:hypothetical protein
MCFALSSLFVQPIFYDKAKSILSGLGTVSYSTMVGSDLARKYFTRLKCPIKDKRSILFERSVSKKEKSHEIKLDHFIAMGK